jgi:histidine ammonia-lyase
LLNAAQALDFRRPETTSPYLEEFVAKYREKVQFIENDKVMYNDINTSVKFLQDVVFELPDEDVSVFKL